MELTILRYETASGDVPFTRWADSLDKSTRLVVAVAVNRMAGGNFGDWKSVGDGVFERRVDYGPGYRLYFGRHGQNVVLLLCGGSKRTQPADIKSAKRYWKEWVEHGKRR